MAGNTLNRNYPYPTGTDANDVPYRMQALAEAVDADITGILATPATPAVEGAVALGTGWTALGGAFAPVAAYKSSEGIVTVQGLIRRTGATITAAASGTIATLPVGYRPNGQIYISQSRDGGVVTLIFNSTGTISAELNGTWTTNASFVSLHATFKAA